MSTEPSTKKPRTALPSGRIVLNVGGTLFSTSKVTLATSSSYFESQFSNEWESSNPDDEFFLDQDPSTFPVLLSYMRLGSVSAADLTSPVLLQAQFLGMGALLRAVRHAVRREIFAGKSDTLFKAASAAGILDGTEMAKKEYAKLSVFYPTDRYFTHEGEIPTTGKNLVAEIEYTACDGNGGVEALSFFGTFIDALNWLHRNRYTRHEVEMNTIEVTDNWSTLGTLFFSRIAEESSEMIDETDEIVQDWGEAFGRREFAAFVSYSVDSFSEVAGGEKLTWTVEPEQGTVELEQTTAEVTVKRKRRSDVEAMNWLQMNRFTRREKNLEEFYFSALSNAGNTGPEDASLKPHELSVAMWSKPSL